MSVYDPDIGARSMSYFDQGWMKTHTNGTGQTVVYGYDGIGRITRGELHRWNGVAVDPAIEELFEYHYDVAKDGLPGCRTQGRLAWVAEPAGSAQFCYVRLAGRSASPAASTGCRRGNRWPTGHSVAQSPCSIA